MVDEQQFRQSLSRFASGVTVVTMDGGEEVYGITVTAFMSVSLDPPLIAVSVGRRSRAHATMLATERFGISILADWQQNVADAFAGRAGARKGPTVRRSGFPFVAGAHAWLLCSRYDAHEAGDHTVFLGLVEEAGWQEGGSPLTYYRSRYGSVRESTAESGVGNER